MDTASEENEMPLVEISTPAPCSYCDEIGYITCPTCYGTGKYMSAINEITACRKCHGSGRLTCPYCSGTGRIQYCRKVWIGSGSDSSPPPR